MKVNKDVLWFNENIKPFLNGYLLSYSSFQKGDFGNLERIEVEGFEKLATVEFWSKGWVGIDIYDCALDTQVMNVLLSPEDGGSVVEAFGDFVEALTKNRGGAS
ncbi:hypothetical protein [Achromobacter dolens]|uniref:hypothetical protein n=1 Tax=Achromobacter dolens TaxID=1287738 RepID=UPI001581639B|nr:hypothetical protein [Achromobacter dolens]